MITAQVVLINSEGLVLGVSRKTDHNDFGLAGGKMDPEDNGNPEATAIRETKEETGLDIYDLKLVFAIHKHGNMGYTYLAKYSGEIKHNEPHVVKWLAFERLVNGSFGKYNQMVSESLDDMDVNYLYADEREDERLEDEVRTFINDEFKDTDIRFSFMRKGTDWTDKVAYTVYLTSDEPDYLDEGLIMPKSFDNALQSIGDKYSVIVRLSSNYTPK